MTDVDALLGQADRLLEKNRIVEARILYEEITRLAPENPDAWFMLGLIEQEHSNLAAAEAHLRRAIELDDQFAEAHLNLANLMRLLGRRDEAMHHARLALQSDEGFTEAWVFLGGLYQSQGMAAEAASNYRRALQLEPQQTETWLQLGGLSMQLGDIEDAVDCYRQAATQAPQHAEAHNKLAGALMRQGKYDEAQAHCHQALKIKPDYAEADANLGNLYLETNRHQEAVQCFLQALQINPDFVGALTNLGYAYRQQRKFQEAIVCYEKALRIAPDLAEAYLDLGNVHLELGDLERAAQFLAEGIRRAPLNAKAHLNLGYALKAQDRLHEAKAQFVLALGIDPGLAQAYFNLGLTHKALGDYAEAANCYRKALSIEPGDIDVQSSLSLISLLLGRLKEGWQYYRARPSMRDHEITTPDSLPRDLHGKRILLLKDQGIGDEIFFLRFAPLLKERGAWIAYRADPKIASLVARLPSIDQVVGPDETPHSIDATLSIGDLPFLLDVNDIAELPPPVHTPVLAEVLHAMRNKLGAMGKEPYIGITWWAGTPQTGANLDEKLAYREVPLPLLAQALCGLDATILILQRNPSKEDIAYIAQTVGSPVHDLSSINDDLERMLALLSLLGDYVGVDNTNMHLSACVNKPGRILVPHPPEWRSMTTGGQSVWFPGFTMYRQTSEGDWSGAIEALESDLARFKHN